MCSNAQRDPKWHPPPELHRKQILEVGTPEACAAAVAAFLELKEFLFSETGTGGGGE